MRALLSLLGVAVLFVVVAALADLVSEEVRGRLDMLPHGLLELAVRRLPADLRDELRREWRGELHEVLRGAEALPATRLLRGLRYAAGLLRVAPTIARAFGCPPRAPRFNPRVQLFVANAVVTVSNTVNVIFTASASGPWAVAFGVAGSVLGTTATIIAGVRAFGRGRVDIRGDEGT